ncbi:MAG: hypothetical protein QMD04_04375 [Anaerolineales bacterium]|nr:hypothetical protein [Anaerolineales bacterium]
METIAYAQIQELIMRLPARKLPLAYSLLTELVEKESDELSPQVQFMLLPLAERQRIMARQVKKMVTHYEESAVERQEWQAGDFLYAD